MYSTPYIDGLFLDTKIPPALIGRGLKCQEPMVEHQWGFILSKHNGPLANDTPESSMN